MVSANDRSLAARAWWQDGASWAQYLWDNWPKDSPRSQNKLVDKMLDHWEQRPFEGGPKSARGCPKEPDSRDLVKRIFPIWKQMGWLNLEKR